MNSLESLYRQLVRTCDEIDAAWASDSYRLTTFPELVLARTADLDLTPFGELDRLMPLLGDPKVARLQQLSSFSDLYIKLYDNGRFWVEILNWWGSDINIHDHDFAGIQFQLCGSSLNVDYSFEVLENCGDVCFGPVSVTGAKVWRKGDRSISLPGRNTPHNVCHLDLPTVSLLIRTHPHKHFGPQWNYFPPGVAGNYGIANATFRKGVTALRLLSKGDPTRFRQAFRQHTAPARPEQLLFTLIKMIDIVFEPEFIDVVNDIAGTGNPVTDSIIEAAAFHRAIETLKAFRHRTELSWNERIALATVGSAFDSKSVKAIVKSLRVHDFDGDVMSILQMLRGRSADAQNSISMALSLFGLVS